MKNIRYQNDNISQYFNQNRIRWEQFYESEKKIIGRLPIDPEKEVLDIGCGCGGLGLALKEKFGLEKYTGVEINVQAAEAGRTMNPNAEILCGDILDLTKTSLKEKEYDVVFSLSCVDWNVQYLDMLNAAWKHVKPGGYFISTFRLTNLDGCNDMKRSYQYINYEGVREGEKASYVVLNASELFQQLKKFEPKAVNAFGYWGAPSSTAITPYETLCFVAFSIQKRIVGDDSPITFDLTLPEEILKSIDVKTQ
ncbi:class I SAM-dependent methyltransferase [Leptospira kmetyi]|uniref:class I SAM-dependent methyltransferase n=1 Tax=Leptospira kmetyi TaxID=408139 RepID=UPI0010844957|nr:class I SAM-dependent methyltransferase [Leptospira kmetyi]TGL68295.1 class I SAM-dependent methyltransferase [Leptospira kmetyi]